MTDIKILVVEDDPGCRDVLKEILSRCRYSFQLVKTAQEARDRISREQFDIVFTDIVGVDGFDILRLSKGLNPSVEVVVLSGDVQNGADSLKRGASGFIAKPFTVQEVVAKTHEVVDRVLRRRLNGNGSLP